MLDDTGSFCNKNTEKTKGFMHVFKDAFTADNGQLLIFPDKYVECNYNAIDLSTRNVYKYLQNANKQSAAGPNGELGSLWSHLVSSLSLPLAIIFNVSVATSILPSIRKLSYKSPTYKKGDKSNFNKYRPVALTCFAGRVMDQ